MEIKNRKKARAPPTPLQGRVPIYSPVGIQFGTSTAVSHQGGNLLWQKGIPTLS